MNGYEIDGILEEVNSEKKISDEGGSGIFVIFMYIVGILLGSGLIFLGFTEPSTSGIEKNLVGTIIYELCFAIPMFLAAFSGLYTYLNEGNDRTTQYLVFNILKSIYDKKIKRYTFNENNDDNIKESMLWEDKILTTKKISEYRISDSALENFYGVDIRKSVFGISEDMSNRVKALRKNILTYIIMAIIISLGSFVLTGRVMGVFNAIMLTLLVSIPINVIINSMTRISTSIFNGFLCRYSINKKINGNIFIYTDKLEKNIGIYSKTLQSMNKSKSLVKMEDIRFEKEYVVYADNEVDARYILTPRLMEILTEIKEQMKSDVCISVIEDKLYFAIDMNKNLIEASRYEKIEKKDLENIVSRFEIFKNIEDEIKGWV